MQVLLFFLPLCFQGSESDFETVYQQCVRCCRAFLEKAR